MILPANAVGYIDFGITGLMSAYSRRHLVVMTLALVRGDLQTMAAEYLAITVHDAGSDIAGFRAGLARLTAGWYQRRGGRLRLRERITLIFGQMLELSRQNRVMPERDIVKYIRSAIAIDGLLTRFAPAFDIGAHLETACAELLAWEARRGLVDPERMLDWATAGGRLLADGPQHAAQAVERLEAGRRPAPAAAAGTRRRSRALLLAGAVFGAAVLFAGPAGPAAGQPLWTAELVFLAAAGSLLAANLVRLRG
jgi:predicted unusual protein kinase regulating ubiquinone biosynthesis (AarF/ABC1/UbiB family)